MDTKQQIEEMAKIIQSSRYENGYISQNETASALYDEGYGNIAELKSENEQLAKIIEHNCDEAEFYKGKADNIEKEVEELKAENERIRQNSVTHESLEILLQQKDKEIALRDEALKIVCRKAVELNAWYDCGVDARTCKGIACGDGKCLEKLENLFIQQAETKLKEKTK